MITRRAHPEKSKGERAAGSRRKHSAPVGRSLFRRGVGRLGWYSIHDGNGGVEKSAGREGRTGRDSDWSGIRSVEFDIK